MEKTSLEKSHSKWSNFKLTVLCLSITISVSVIWAMLAFIKVFMNNITIIIFCVAAIILFVNIFLLAKFKR